MFNACRNIYTYIYIYIFITIIYLFIYLFIYLRSVVHQWNGAYFELDVLKFTITQPLFHGSWVKCSPAKSQWVKMLRGMCCKYLYIYICTYVSIYLSIYPSTVLSFYPPRQISRTQVHILWCRVPLKIFFSAEVLGTNIESAEVHYTKREDEFRPNIGLNTKFRWKKKFSAEVSYTICVVEFRRRSILELESTNLPQ